MCDMTDSHVWLDLFDAFFALWHDSFTCVPWLIYVCDITHSRACHDSCTCVTWFIHTCDMTRSHVCHDFVDAFTCATSAVYVYLWDITHSNVWHDLFKRVTWHIQTCDMYHSNAIFAHLTRAVYVELRLSPHLLVSFAKEPYKRDNIRAVYV